MRLARPRHHEPDTGTAGAVALSVGLLRRLMGRGDDLSLAAEDLAESIARMAESTNDTTKAAAAAGAATSRVAHESNSVAVAAREMSAAMQEVARSAAEATTVTIEATRVTEQVRQSVDRLSASTDKIDDVVKVVTGISDQTRLLALNATIEAARAGAAGKGFAVVAEEVKNLAAQTGDATAQITGQLSELASDSDGVSHAVERIDEVLARIDALQQTIGAAVEQQTAAIAEITRSAGEAAEAAHDLDGSITLSVEASRQAGEALERSRMWLDRLGAAAWAQREEISGLGEGIQTHPLRAAIVAHAGWKKRLRQSIDDGRLVAGIDPSTAMRDDVCAFGKWLRSGEAEALDANRWRAVVDQHAVFHREASRVVTAVSGGNLAGARELMASPEAYGGAAATLTDALIAWVGVVESDDVTDWKERRTAPRRAVDGAVELTHRGTRLKAKVGDLSKGGLRCSGKGLETLRIGETVDLTLTVGSQKVSLAGRVAWVTQIGGHNGQCGFEFTGLSEATRRTITGLAG